MSGTFFYPQSGPATGPELLNYGIYPILGSQNFRDTPAWLNLWRGPALFNTLIVFVILESLFISLYLYSRMLSKTTKEWDVWLMLFAFLFNVGLISAIFIDIEHARLGRHLSRHMKPTAILFQKINKTIEFLYPVSVALPKLAISCLYYRIFVTPTYRRAIIAVATIVFLNWICALIVVITICQPFSYHWINAYQRHEIGHCGDVTAAYWSISVPNLVTDVAILVLPLHGIWHLHAKTAKKIGLAITFLTGGIGLITGIIRPIKFYEVGANAGDPTWDSNELLAWTVIEPGVYLITATLPFLRPLLIRVFKHIQHTSLYQTSFELSRTRLRRSESTKKPMASPRFDKWHAGSFGSSDGGTSGDDLGLSSCPRISMPAAARRKDEEMGWP